MGGHVRLKLFRVGGPRARDQGDCRGRGRGRGRGWGVGRNTARRIVDPAYNVRAGETRGGVWLSRRWRFELLESMPVSKCAVALRRSYQWQLGALERTFSWWRGNYDVSYALGGTTNGKAKPTTYLPTRTQRSPVLSNLAGNHPGHHRQLPARRAAPGTPRCHHTSQPRSILVPNPKAPSPSVTDPTSHLPGPG